MNKLGIAPEFIEKRYQEALAEKKSKEALDPSCVLLLEVTMAHNMKDVAKFSLDNVDNMLQQFFDGKYKERIMSLYIFFRTEMVLIIPRFFHQMIQSILI